MTAIHKLALLLEVAYRRPVEFLDRLKAIVTVQIEKNFGRKPAYQFQTMRQAEEHFEQSFAWHFAAEYSALDQLEQQVRESIQRLGSTAPFMLTHNADFNLARQCYAICRMLKPEVVVETGVAYGVTTTFILNALALNGQGMLNSIDLPPLGDDADSFVGILVPEDLRSRWTLHRGVSRRILPELLPQLGKVGMFVHDSLHTYWNIKFELNTVLPYLSRPSAVLADDIEGNIAFQEWIQAASPHSWAAVQEKDKDSAFGIAVLR